MDKLESREKEDWKKNVWFYEKHKSRIREHYTSIEFIVIKNQKIIDSGTNQFSLARKYPEEDVLIISPPLSDIVDKFPSLKRI